MNTAVVTFVYNEAVNLPVWIRYYGDIFGKENLFVVDRGSQDGSTDGLDPVAVITVPRKEFDEHDKTDFMSNFHRSLLSFFDVVIITDCDELLVPEPSKFKSLREYIDHSDFEYVNAVGVDVLHILNEESPIDLSVPILWQRNYARFHSPACKALISRIPIVWLPGFHSCNKPPVLDPNLYLFHTKVIDYNLSMNRQKINRDTVWSERSLKRNYGAHWRFDYQKFVHMNFLVPMDVIKRGLVADFEFHDEIKRITDGTARDQDGFYRIPMDITKYVRIPERVRGTF